MNITKKTPDIHPVTVFINPDLPIIHKNQNLKEFPELIQRGLIIIALHL